MLRTHTCGELTAKHSNKKVTLCGWIETIRLQGKIGFLLLRDRDGITQVFLNPKLAKEFGSLSNETVVQITGTVKKRPDNQVKKDQKTGEIELSAEEIKIISEAKTPLPIILDEETTTQIDKRLDYRFLDIRRKKIEAIFKIRSKVVEISTEFFKSQNFININSPKLTASGVESGAEEFKIDYFGRKAALAQSPQLYKQMFVMSGLEKVFEIGAVFRAEKSHTTRHLTEFTGIDMEMGFIKDEHDVLDIIEAYFKFLTKEIRKQCKEELTLLKVTVNTPKEIPRLDFKQVRSLLRTKGKVIPEDDDLDPEAERLISEIVKKNHKSDFVFILNYPWAKRPFYHMKLGENGTRSYDLIYNGVEIGTGAQREHRLEILDKQAKEKKIDLKKLEFYRDIFKYGSIPHGGIGLGLDRIVEQMLNLGNVREAILLPRDPERLTP